MVFQRNEKIVARSLMDDQYKEIETSFLYRCLLLQVGGGHLMAETATHYALGRPVEIIHTLTAILDIFGESL